MIGPYSRTQNVGDKRETARRRSLRQAVVASSRGDKTPLELFLAGIQGLVLTAVQNGGAGGVLRRLNLAAHNSAAL